MPNALKYHPISVDTLRQGIHVLFSTPPPLPAHNVHITTDLFRRSMELTHLAPEMVLSLLNKCRDDANAYLNAAKQHFKRVIPPEDKLFLVGLLLGLATGMKRMSEKVRSPDFRQPSKFLQFSKTKKPRKKFKKSVPTDSTPSLTVQSKEIKFPQYILDKYPYHPLIKNTPSMFDSLSAPQNAAYYDLSRARYVCSSVALAEYKYAVRVAELFGKSTDPGTEEEIDEAIRCFDRPPDLETKSDPSGVPPPPPPSPSDYGL